MRDNNSSGHPPPRRSSLTERQLLQCIVEVALRVFRARASSIFLIDPATGELVFEAVAGAGAGALPGTRFPAGTGIAGMVVASGEALLADDVALIPQFAQSAAAATGFVPTSIMAAPLALNGDRLGVMEVLDRTAGEARDGLQDMELLTLLATQAALSASLLARLAWLDRGDADGPPATSHPQAELLQRIGTRLPAAGEALSANVLRLLVTADELLGPPR